MPKPKKSKQHYELIVKQPLVCAPGKLRGHMRRRKSELAVNTGNGEVTEFWNIEDAAERECGDLRL